MKWKRWILSLFSWLLLTGPVHAAFGYTPIDADAKAYLIMDLETGEVLQAKNIEQSLAIASISKLLTCMIVVDEVRDGKLKMEETVLATPDCLLSGSTYLIEKGRSYSIRELVRAALVVSGNDASYLLAKSLSGSEDRFVQRMNVKAKELGMKKSLFRTASGLPKVSPDGDNFSSVSDLAKMSREIVLHYPELMTFTKEKWLVAGKDHVLMKNTNPLLGKYQEVDGLKTGFTREAGYCLVFSLTQSAVPYRTENNRYLGIVMGFEDLKQRNAFAEKMTDYILSSYRKEILLHPETPVTKVHLRDAVESEVKLYPREGYAQLLNYNEMPEVKTTLIREIHYPMHRGQKFGEVAIYDKGVEVFRTDLLLDRDIEEIGFFKKWGRRLFGWLSE